jgi:hypothetical protein
MTTQALLGWPLAVLETADEGRWHRVRLPDGYTGWIRAWLVTPDPTGWPGPRVAEVDVPLTWLRREPEATAEPVSDLLLGARLAILPGRAPGWLLLGLPDGRAGGWRGRNCCGRPIGAGAARSPRRRPRHATARRCMGCLRLGRGTPRGSTAQPDPDGAGLHIGHPEDTGTSAGFEKLAHPIEDAGSPARQPALLRKTRDRATHVFATGRGDAHRRRVREIHWTVTTPCSGKTYGFVQVACRCRGSKGRT